MGNHKSEIWQLISPRTYEGKKQHFTKEIRKSLCDLGKDSIEYYMSS